MEETPKSLMKFASTMFSDERKDAFIEAVLGGKKRVSAVVWTKQRDVDFPFPVIEAPRWLPECVDLVDRTQTESTQTVGQHPLHDAGYYYCLDASSVFEVVPLGTLADCPVVLDLCASPGGKSILASRMVQYRQLISNEVIGKRTAQLIANLKRCAIPSAAVTRSDSAIFAEQVPGQVDLVLVDAPCSGQSLIAKGMKNPGCFHKITIERNANRQRRILANATAVLAPGGHLLYTTCTFALQENERTVEWLLKRFPALEAVEVPALEEFRSEYATVPCYRLWPFQGFGAGGFSCLLRSTEGEARATSVERAEIDHIQDALHGGLRAIWFSPELVARAVV